MTTDTADFTCGSLTEDIVKVNNINVGSKSRPLSIRLKSDVESDKELHATSQMTGSLHLSLSLSLAYY